MGTGGCGDTKFMADKTIPDLTAAGAVALTDLFEIAQPLSRKATLTQIQTALTGKQDSLPVADTTSIVMGSVDGTKQLRIEVDGFTAATTRVATPPNQDFTMAGLEVQQTFTKQQTITPAVNTSGLVVSGFSLTLGGTPILDISGTWNTGNVPSALKIDITDTASDAASLLADFRINNAQKFIIKKDGSFFGASGAFDVAADGSFNMAVTAFQVFVDGSMSAASGQFMVNALGNIAVPSIISFNATGGVSLTDDGASNLVISSGATLQFGSAAVSSVAIVADNYILVRDSTGTEYELLCKPH